MRDILFRGKNLLGKWIQGDLLQYRGSQILHIVQNYTGAGGQEVVPETVGQYTGLTDKNGKKIFEGDIIRYADNDEYEMYLESIKYPEEYENADFSKMWAVDEVVYGDKIGYPAFDLNAHNFECNGLATLNDSGQYFYEVIGNIHDNPELLEAEK